MSTLRRIKNVPVLPTRDSAAHKGNFGRVLVISGSVGMAGAPALTANAALRSGAGLVTIAVPEPIAGIVAGLAPCATTIPLPANKAGQIKPAAALKMLRRRGWCGEKQVANPPDALVVGPGIGTGSHDYAENWWELIDAFRIAGEVSTVVDADAINLAALLPSGWEQLSHPRTVFTPHPGELSRLLGTTSHEIQAGREAGALDAARRLNREPAGAIVVLKGAGTLVTDGEYIYTNTTGNPGMATGGSGDVLAGVIGALLGQRVSCLDAAILGVYVHGLAGDLTTRAHGEVSLIATDIIDALPDAFMQILNKRRSKASPRTTQRKKSR